MKGAAAKRPPPFSCLLSFGGRTRDSLPALRSPPPEGQPKPRKGNGTVRSRGLLPPSAGADHGAASAACVGAQIDGSPPCPADAYRHRVFIRVVGGDVKGVVRRSQRGGGKPHGEGAACRRCEGHARTAVRRGRDAEHSGKL